MHAERIDGTTDLPFDLELVSVSYVAPDRTVDVVVKAGASSGCWVVHFKNVEGVRILDERDLLEYWPSCSTRNGSLYRIHSGGWIEQESRREGFLLRDVCEYLVTSFHECVSVLAYDIPKVVVHAECQNRG